MRLLCNGVALDLEAGATMSFKKLNPLFAFDKLTCERTQSFNLPATPTNDLVLELAKIPAYYGAGMRRRFDAELQDGTVVKQGYLYVDKYASGKYSAVFVTGELFGLLKIKQAGKVAELVEFPDVTTYGAAGKYPIQTIGDWDTVNYKQLGGNPLLPSYRLTYIVSVVSDAIGVSINTPEEANGLRVITGKPHAIKAHQARLYSEWVDRKTNLNVLRPEFLLPSGFIASRLSSNQVWIRQYYNASGTLIQTDTNLSEDSAQYVYQYRALANIKLTFPKDLPADIHMVTLPGSSSRYQIGEFIGGYGFKKTVNFDRSSGYDLVRTGEQLAGRTISIPNGTEFVVISEDDYFAQNSWEYMTIGSYTGEVRINALGYDFRESYGLGLAFDIEVTVEGEHEMANSGEAVRLQDNLPAVTLVDLLKAIAGLTGKALNYTDAEGVTFDDLAVDTWPTVEIRQPLGTDEVARKFSDYAQRNTLRFDTDASVPQGARIVSAYVVDNDNLESEKELQIIPFSEGAAAYDESGVELVEVQEDNESDTIANADTTAARMARAALPLNPNLAALCQASTAITVSARMTLQEYEALAAKVTILYAGTRYVWTEAQYSKGVVTLKLSKIPA